jgi:hypothetical protein
MTSHWTDYGLVRYRKVEDKMAEENIAYSLKDNQVKKVEKYLGNNSKEYGFSAKKGEEKYLCFMDNEKRIFAILKKDKKEVELAPYASSRIINGIEKLIDFGGR